MKYYLIYGLVLLCGSLVFGQNFWEANDGPYGGTIYTAISAPNGDTYVGGLGQVFHLPLGSDSWIQLGPGIPNAPVDALAINAAGHLFAGTAIYGIFRSTDGGTGWQEVNAGLNDLFITDMAVAPNGDIYAATYSGLYKSTDNGDSWNSLSNGLPPTFYNAIAIKANGDIFVGSGGGGMYRSLDNGATWSQLNNGLTNLFITTVAIDSLTGDVFAGTGGNGIFQSTDNGDNWSQIFTGTEMHPENPNIWVDAMVIALGVLYLWSDIGGFSSSNMSTFVAMANPFPIHLFVLAMAVTPLGQALVFLEKLGPYISIDVGATWQLFTKGLAAFFVARMDAYTDLILVAGSPGAYMKFANLPWQFTMITTAIFYDYVGRILRAIKPPTDMIESQLPDTLFFASTVGAGFFRSSDNGISWDLLPLSFANFVSDFIIADSGHIFVVTENGVQVSSDYGDTWELRNNGLTTLFASKIAIAPDGTLWISIGPSAYKSTDNGQNWAFSGIGLSGTRLSSFAFGDPGEVYVGSDGGAFYSQDNGNNWTSISSGLGNTEVEALAIKSSTEQTTELRAGTRGGIFRSFDKGNSWEDISSGLNNMTVFSLAFDENGNGYAGTAAGVFRETGATTGTDPISEIQPQSFSLAQNYPNPFNPSTNIRFNLEKPSRVLLTVYNSLGQKVATLVNKEMTSGAHQVTFDASNLAGGTYFYQIRTSEYKQTRKMLLMK